MSKLALAVDDDQLTRGLYRYVLQKMDFEVLEAADGGQAIDLLNAENPDLIFLDVLMPGINGIQVLEYILKTPRLSTSYVVIASAHTRFAKSTYEHLHNEFLLKPILPQQIKICAERALAQKPGDASIA